MNLHLLMRRFKVNVLSVFWLRVSTDQQIQQKQPILLSVNSLQFGFGVEACGSSFSCQRRSQPLSPRKSDVPRPWLLRELRASRALGLCA